MFDAAIATLYCDLGHGVFCVLQEYLRVVEPDLRKILVRCYLHHRLKDPAEVKQADATMLGELLQPDILIEVRKHIVLRFLDGR